MQSVQPWCCNPFAVPSVGTRTVFYFRILKDGLCEEFLYIVIDMHYFITSVLLQV